VATTIAIQRNEQVHLSAALARRTNSESRGLFEHNLIESGTVLQKRSPWTTVASIALQALIIALLCLVHMFAPVTLPKPQIKKVVYLAPPSAAAPAAAPAATSHLVTSRRMQKLPEPDARLQTPTEKPKPITMAKTQEAPTPMEGVVGGTAGGVPGGVVGGVIGGVVGGTGTAPVLAKAVPPPALPRKRVPAALAQGNLIHDVKPQYPPQARHAKLEGTVVLLAVIGKDGSVQDVQVKSGAPLLVQAAIEAVKEWRYKPYLLNGQPVEVDTQIVINFTLS